MKWAILSDIHSNLEAFQAVLEDLEKERPVRVLFLGDAVGYGANPNECLDLLRRMEGLFVVGNHDAGAVGLTDIAEFNADAQAALLWTSERIDPSHRAFLQSLPLMGCVEDATFCHATPFEPAHWRYLFSGQEAMESFRAFSGRVCFVGHSHFPAILAWNGKGGIVSLPPHGLILDPSCRYLVNVGSIGQPRDGDPRAAYGIYDSKKGAFSLRRVRYDIQKASRKILAAGLPHWLAARLFVGQ